MIKLSIMFYYIVSLLNASTWLVCTLSYSTDYGWIDVVFQSLIILCVLLNIFYLFRRKSNRVAEKASLVLYTIISVAFLVRFVLWD